MSECACYSSGGNNPRHNLERILSEVKELAARVAAIDSKVTDLAAKPADPADFIVCGRAGNRRHDLEAVLRDAIDKPAEGLTESQIESIRLAADTLACLDNKNPVAEDLRAILAAKKGNAP